MSVLIKGLKLPKRMPIKAMIFPDGRVFVTLHSRKTLECSAVPVPPHGRLGDLDALFDEVYKAWGVEYDEGECNTLMGLINGAPTIIETEEESEK